MQRFRQKTATLADSTRSAFDLFFEVFIPGLLLGDYFQAVYDSLPGLARRASGSSSLRPPSKMYSVAAKGGADERRSYREWLSAVFWAVLLGSIGIYCIDVAFFNPGLTLPSSASYQLFYDTHPFEVWDMKYSPMFTTASVAGVKYYIQWWFGIEGTDDSNSWDPTSAGTTRIYPMDIYKKESQQFFWDFAQEVESKDWWSHTDQWFMKDVRGMMMGDCNRWNATVTIESGQLYKCCGHEEFPWEVRLDEDRRTGGAQRRQRAAYIFKDPIAALLLPYAA